MRTVRQLATLAIALLGVIGAINAQVVVSGRVLDTETNEPIVGATVYNKAKGEGTATDIDGYFKFKTNDNFPITVEVSFMGYVKQVITISDQKEISVAMNEESQQLNEIVAVGYGTQKRTQLTGAVTSIKAELIENSPTPTVDGALTGAVAGLNITASSGQPGATSSIRIRGGNSVNASNDPLYVVDGFIYFKNADNNGTGLGAIESSINPLATINPNDIESIEVLKDVSATAIYGSRGANGVILITTKKGTKGQKNIVRYSYTLGIDQVTKQLDLMDANEWAAFQKKYYFNKGKYSDEDIKTLGTGEDWQDAMLRTAINQTHEFSVNGGGDKSRYSFSANYTNHDGIIINSGLKRYNFHVNTDWEIIDNLKLGVNMTYGKTTQEGLTTTEEVKYNSSPYSAGITNSFVYGLLMPKVVNIYNQDGSYNYRNPYEYAYFAIGNKTSNAVSDLENSVGENINGYFLGNFWASYRWKDFTFKASLGLNNEKLTQNYFSPSYTSLGLSNTGVGGTGHRNTEVWQQEYTINWGRELNDDNYLDAMVGFTRQTSENTYSSVTVTHFTNEELKQYNLADGSEIYPPLTGISESELNSFIARVNYTLKNRYNATATFRADNSSRFASSYRWGYFPSIGLSWNVNQESFLRDVEKLDNLKIRASFGTVGNQEISDHAFTTSYTTGQYNGSSSYNVNNVTNDKLKWETTASYNIGADVDLLGRRLGFVVDFYYKKTSDLLLDVPMGFASGVSSQIKNVGNVENKGIEFSVSSVLAKTKDFTWTLNANVAHNKNEITDMGTTNNVIQGSQNQQILRKGEALGSFYGLKFDHIVGTNEDTSNLPTIAGSKPKPGQAIFVDTNNDKKIDGNDRQILGSIQPDLTFGLSTSVQWRNFDAFVSIQGTHGNKVFNSLGRVLEQPNDAYNMLKSVLNSWTPDNQNSKLGYASYTRDFSYIDDRYVEDASYLKLRNVTLGYRPKIKSETFGLRVFVTGGNLLTATKYKGYDPEVSSGTDTGAYPAARTFSFGVSLHIN